MSVRSTKGLKIYLSKSNATPVIKDGTAGSSTLTAIAANGTDTDLTVDAIAGIAIGDPVTFSGTGFPELDGKSYIVTVATGTTITVNADITGTTGAFDAANAEASFLPMSEMQNLCPNSIAVDANVPGTISVGTFCDPSASIPATVVEAGNITLGQYHDPDSAGFMELMKAEEMGDERMLVIAFPGDQGHMIAHGTVSSFALSDVPLDGASAWQATFALASKPEFRY